MAKVIDKISAWEASHSPSTADTQQIYFSFEFFPPKTDAGVENLYLRMDRMTSLQPMFIDITWGAGGSTKDLTITISEYSQTYFGVDALMHLTCTAMKVDDLKKILIHAKDSGIRNILALRGDPPKGALSWEPMAGGCDNATELVKLIRKEHGDYFCIAVAGFPEGHPQNNGLDQATELLYLKNKIDAGADFILTQFFYDPNVFIEFVTKCKNIGITCPIIPGMMPIQSYSSFQKMTSFCRARVPTKVWRELEPIKDDDEAVKAYGVKLCSEMVRVLRSAGTYGFHFYTLNLEKSVVSVLQEVGVEETIASRRPLPWRSPRNNNKPNSNSNSSNNLTGLMLKPTLSSSGSGSAASSQSASNGILNRANASVEDVRPINWANRPKSYIKRTVTWDEFPNGRWGDNRSPAFGELSETHFYRPIGGSRADRLAMWGEAPINHCEVFEVFAKYVEGKIPIIPWCETALAAETKVITSPLSAINRAGFLTINSQPAVNGEKSSSSVYGWGGDNGRVYQKAYIEFFTSIDKLKVLMHTINFKYPDVNFYAVDSSGKNNYSSHDKGVTALTWGVFANKEILQPTIFDPDTFVIWSEEAFQLWRVAWASLYDDETDSCALLHDIHDTYYLVAIIDNDYVSTNIYTLMDEVMAAIKKDSETNGIDADNDNTF